LAQQHKRFFEIWVFSVLLWSQRFLPFLGSVLWILVLGLLV